MQNAAFRVLGEDASYELCDVGAGDLASFLAGMRGGAYSGANVTIPHKRAAAVLCDHLEGDAVQLRAVNTLIVAGGSLVGDNTDARGFELALRRLGVWPEPGFIAVVFGAGGAAGAVTLAIARAGAARTRIVARAPAAVADMATGLDPLALEGVAWSRDAVTAAVEDADLVVNATPLGLRDLPLALHNLRASCRVADVRYRPRPVDLVAAAAASGHHGCDGAEMLLQQGMLSLRRWTGAEPPWDAARAALLTALEA